MVIGGMSMSSISWKYSQKKNRFVVHYEWEGTLKEDGHTYHYRCMEIIKTNFSDNRIYSIEGLWTEKQFRDQFK